MELRLQLNSEFIFKSRRGRQRRENQRDGNIRSTQSNIASFENVGRSHEQIAPRSWKQKQILP
jgi:hypothetical protein